jgi:hypothetical protein
MNYLLIFIACILTSSCQSDKYIETVKSNVLDSATIVSTSVPANNTLLYTSAGVALFVLGALTSAFWDKKSGLILIVCGVASGTVPYIITSAYFAWISALTLVGVASIGIWYLRWKAMHEAKEEEEEDNKDLDTK